MHVRNTGPVSAFECSFQTMLTVVFANLDLNTTPGVIQNIKEPHNG